MNENRLKTSVWIEINKKTTNQLMEKYYMEDISIYSAVIAVDFLLRVESMTTGSSVSRRSKINKVEVDVSMIWGNKHDGMLL